MRNSRRGSELYFLYICEVGNWQSSRTGIVFGSIYALRLRHFHIINALCSCLCRPAALIIYSRFCGPLLYHTIFTSPLLFYKWHMRPVGGVIFIYKHIWGSAAENLVADDHLSLLYEGSIADNLGATPVWYTALNIVYTTAALPHTPQ